MEEEISLVEIGQVLLKRWKLLFVLPLLAAAFAYAYSIYFVVPEYRSSAALIILPLTEQAEGTGILRHDIDSTRQVVEYCKELTLSHAGLQRMINDLNLEYSVDKLRGRIEIDVATTTSIEVTDPDPATAYEIADHVTYIMMEHVTGTARLDNVQLLNPAQLPLEPVDQRTPLNVAVAVVLALMVATALAFLFEHLDNTIKTADDVEKPLGVPVLGVIPEIEDEGRHR